jgi:hypothetical protein
MMSYTMFGVNVSQWHHFTTSVRKASSISRRVFSPSRGLSCPHGTLEGGCGIQPAKVDSLMLFGWIKGAPEAVNELRALPSREFERFAGENHAVQDPKIYLVPIINRTTLVR